MPCNSKFGSHHYVVVSYKVKPHTHAGKPGVVQVVVYTKVPILNISGICKNIEIQAVVKKPKSFAGQEGNSCFAIGNYHKLRIGVYGNKVLPKHRKVFVTSHRSYASANAHLVVQLAVASNGKSRM